MDTTMGVQDSRTSNVAQSTFTALCFLVFTVLLCFCVQCLADNTLYNLRSEMNYLLQSEL